LDEAREVIINDNKLGIIKKGVMVSPVEPRCGGLTDAKWRPANLAMHGVEAFARYGSTGLTMTPNKQENLTL
jgi:hypothetical protein